MKLPTFAPTCIALALFGAAGAWAQTAPAEQTAPTTQTAAPAGTTTQTAPAPATASTPTNKLVSSFTPLAGSSDNAASLVNGLRTGSTVTLTGAPTATAPGESVTFTPPTRPMGYGNIRIAMSLAEAQLASQGITNPTPTQLQGALMGATTTSPGGTTTTSQGILQMRASGMGWGQVAHSMGFKLGPVMSGKQTFTAATTSGATATADTTSSTTAAGTTAGSSKSSVTTAAGTTAHGKSSVTTAGGGNAGGHGRSSVVTAGGGGGAVTTGLGHGHGAGASSGVVSAGGGQGAAHGKGGGKP